MSDNNCYQTLKGNCCSGNNSYANLNTYDNVYKQFMNSPLHVPIVVPTYGDTGARHFERHLGPQVSTHTNAREAYNEKGYIRKRNNFEPFRRAGDVEYLPIKIEKP